MQSSWTTIHFLILFAVLSTSKLQANEKLIKIYHDADYSNHKESAEAMLMGMQTALSEIGHNIQDYTIVVESKDHRGNSNRSKLHMKQFLKDPNALFMLGGLHSPPYIKYREFINKNRILLLVPWAAGGPITRYSEGPNWVFRLSIDDTKAGYRMAKFASDELKCETPHLLLEDTPWGHSNDRTMTRAFKENDDYVPKKTWFNWNTKSSQARILLRDIARKGGDCLLFVGNAIEGEVFSNAMASLTDINIKAFISHWGITGGDFKRQVSHDVRDKINLHFIQTCFSFVSSKPTPVSTAALSRVKSMYPEKIKEGKDIPAPPGFVHAYDLGRIVAQAIAGIKLTGEMTHDRKNLRLALENITQPVEGLVKTYHSPFSQWTMENDDAHEALGLEDFCMARYLEDGAISVFQTHVSGAQ